MNFIDIIPFDESWNNREPFERIQILLQEHCHCRSVNVLSHTPEFVTFEIRPPFELTLKEFFRTLKDLSDSVTIQLLPEEKINIEFWISEMNPKTISNK